MDRSILVVDDEVDIRELVVLILRDAGFMVAEAQSGMEALALLATRRFDLLILDIMLPDMRGWEICWQLAATHAELPVIVFTVRSPMQDEAEMACMKPDRFIHKPFDRQDLLDAVSDLLVVTV